MNPDPRAPLAPEDARTLEAWLRDARRRTLALVEDLEGEAWLGPRLPIVNPPLWEAGHVAYFQEWWCLRGGSPGRPSHVADADALYDSARVPHKVRWDLPLPDPAATHAYLASTLERTLEQVGSGRMDEGQAYFVRLAVFHEDMHDEALLYSRQTWGLPPPRHVGLPPEPPATGSGGGDVVVPGGRFVLGARPGAAPFVFDNEKWGHEVDVPAFRMARHAVTEGEFEAFVEDGGYRRRELWSESGWGWREREAVEAPWAWVEAGGRWARRRFGEVVPLSPRRAMVHVGWYEAEAWCRWAGRRLPTEAEWERAATYGGPAADTSPFPWGRAAPAAERAHLGLATSAPADVGAYAAGDSPLGLRQLWGNVWEWTSSDFAPYPGFVADPYKEYSEPWFWNHKVLRGGCFATQPRLLRSTWRNFYTPDRRDVWAGLRTCALERP
jgi:iron(II)-dependent oxidoreductase